MTTKLAIAIDLDELRRLMREFTDSRVVISEVPSYELRFEHFLQWLRRKRTGDDNGTKRQYSGTSNGLI